MADAKERPSWRAPRWLKFTLAASLALNLAVIGILGGMALRFSGSGKPPRFGGHGEFSLIAALKREDRKAVFDQMRKSKRKGRGWSQDGRAQLLALLRAEAFDRAAMEALLEARQMQSRARQIEARDIWLSHVGAMTPEARRIYADRLENWREKRGKRGRKDRP